MSSESDLDELVKSLETTKEEMHNLNLRKMDPDRLKDIEDEEQQAEMGRTYPLMEAKSTARAALTNCTKISQLTSSVDSLGASELKREVDKASASFDAAKDSPTALDGWYRDHLTPLLARAERLGQEALKDTTGADDYSPGGKKPKTGLSLDES